MPEIALPPDARHGHQSGGERKLYLALTFFLQILLVIGLLMEGPETRRRNRSRGRSEQQLTVSGLLRDSAVKLLNRLCWALLAVV